MKRVWCLILALIMLHVLSACTEKEPVQTKPTIIVTTTTTLEQPPEEKPPQRMEKETQRDTFVYDENGNLIKETTIDEDHEDVTTYEYDEEGRKIAVRHYRDGEEEDATLWEYDNRGKLVQYVTMEDGIESYGEHHTYDDAGHLIETVTIMDGEEFSRDVMQYDAAGNNTTLEILYLEDQEHLRYEYAHDTKGNIILRRYFYEGEEESCDEYTYDEEGRKTQRLSINPDGSEGSRSIWVYDEKGNLLEESEWYEGELYFQYLYTYDEKGNTLTSTSQLGEEPPTIYEYRYDEAGNEIAHFENGEQTYAATYDADGKFVESIIYHNGKERSRYRYVYEGELLAEEYYYRNGKTDSHIVYTYDENGNEIEKREDDGHQPTYRQVSIYDEEGRLIEQVHYTYSSWVDDFLDALS